MFVIDDGTVVGDTELSGSFFVIIIGLVTITAGDKGICCFGEHEADVGGDDGDKYSFFVLLGIVIAEDATLCNDSLSKLVVDGDSVKLLCKLVISILIIPLLLEIF